jgi:signal recognition particle receptor subunit beta
MVDSSAPQRLSQAKKELHMLLENRELEGIPLLVLSNKQDLQQTLTQAELVKGLNLDYIDSVWAVVSVSSLTGQGVERAIEWLLSQSLRLVQ